MTDDNNSNAAIDPGSLRDPAWSELWDELDRRQQHLLACLHDLATLCAAVVPDRSALPPARWHTASAARLRMEYLMGTVIPAIESHGMPADRVAVIGLRDATPAYQRRISAFLSQWPTDRMFAHWPTYQAEAAGFRQTVSDRVATEVALLRPLLRRLALDRGARIDRMQAGKPPLPNGPAR